MFEKLFRYKIVAEGDSGHEELHLTDLDFQHIEPPQGLFARIKLARRMRKGWHSRNAWIARELAAVDEVWVEACITSLNNYFAELRSAMEAEEVEKVRACVKRATREINVGLISEDLPFGGWRCFNVLEQPGYREQTNGLNTEEQATIRKLLG